MIATLNRRSGDAAAGPSSSSCELADIFRQYGQAYRQTHRLGRAQRKAMWDIEHCRTETLGGYRERCPACGYEREAFRSCRNRNCPKCQSMATAAWVAARQAELLPVPYFHLVFTLPHELNALILYSEGNLQALLDLLFDAAARTLSTFGREHLGGKVGFVLVLHTWDQRLRAHFHVHGLMASGALSPDGARWIAGGRDFLFPVHGLSKMFRGKYLDGVSRLLAEGDLDLPPQLEALRDTDHRRHWLRQCGKKSWVVYAQAPFAGPRKLVDYLGRYTHRTAIGNQRIISCEDGQVTFRYRDRADGDREKYETLPVDEFLDRFLQHVLPGGFFRVRHYGLLANCVKRKLLPHCRRLLGAAPHPRLADGPRTAAEWMQHLLGIDVTRCPCCGGNLEREPLTAEGPLPGAPYAPWADRKFEPWNTS
jgi:hypothetical protein